MTGSPAAITGAARDDSVCDACAATCAGGVDDRGLGARLTAFGSGVVMCGPVQPAKKNTNAETKIVSALSWLTLGV